MTAPGDVRLAPLIGVFARGALMSRTAAVSFDTKVPVLVLKVGHYTLHHGGVGIVRSLGRVGISVYGVHEDRFAPAARSKYLQGSLVWPNDDLEVDQLLEGMAAIGGSLDHPTILIPTDDFAAILIAEHAAMLDRWFVFPRPPSGLPREVASKKSLYLLCKRLGVPCPEA